jgi:transcriptional regulator with XRE-family HTH domain
MGSEQAQTPEEVLGDAVGLQRKARGLSQQQLAKRMRDRGFAWTHNTASLTERAKRGVSVNEMVALGLILGVNIRTLLRPQKTAVDVGGVVIKAKMFTPWLEGRGVLEIAADDSLRLDPALFAAAHPELFRGER